MLLLYIFTIETTEPYSIADEIVSTYNNLPPHSSESIGGRWAVGLLYLFGELHLVMEEIWEMPALSKWQCFRLETFQNWIFYWNDQF